ncbi:MAG: hypothetical protein SPF00_01590, partial [Candidatus Egerieousia sp.]|nr:hypothetical protein [Candidatus Egerieousia sp.]
MLLAGALWRSDCREAAPWQRCWRQRSGDPSGRNCCQGASSGRRCRQWAPFPVNGGPVSEALQG